MRINKKEYYIELAKLTAKLSTCVSKQVGGVLVSKDGRVLMTGYNGTAKGCKHCFDIFNTNFNRIRHHKWSIENELHCEENILMYCCKNKMGTDNTILYLTLSPCIHCAKLILQSGIKEVYYLEEYDLDKSGIKYLNNHIKIKKVK